jgi:hypothetical protein
MANRKNPAVPETQEPVTLTLDGHDYPIAFGFNDLCAVESLVGSSAINEVGRGMSLTFIRGMLVIALARSGRMVTLEEAGELLGSFENATRVGRTLLHAYKMSQARKKPDPRQAPGEASNGANSGQSHATI